MASTAHDELSRAELHLEKGEHQEAFALVETIVSREGLGVDDRLACSLLESRIRLELGEPEEALEVAEEVLQTARERENRLQVVEFLIVKAEACWRSGKLDEGLEAVEEGEELISIMGRDHEGESQEEMKQKEGVILHHGGIICWYKGDLDRAQEYHQQSLAIKEEQGSKQGIAGSLSNLGLVYWSKGDLDQSIDYQQQSIAILEELGIQEDIARTLINLGNAYSLKGDLDQALECYQRSLMIRMELDSKQDIAISLVNIGVVYRMKGELDQALEYYKRCLAISEELGSKLYIALALNNMGDIYQLQGDLDQALDLFEKSLDLYKELTIKQDTAMSLLNIGDVYWKKEAIEEALSYLHQSLTIYEELENDPYTAIVLHHLVSVAIDNDDPNAAKLYLQKLKLINERTDNRAIDQRYRIAKAISLKASKSARHMVKAGEILEQVVEEEITVHSLTVNAMIHLCDLLVLELKVTGEERVLENIKDLTHQLLGIAEAQSSHSLLVETYLLQSKFALVGMDVEGAKESLAKAQKIAEEKGLHLLARKAAHERDLLQSQLHQWESIIQQNPSRQEMIDLTQLDDLLERMIHKTVAVLTEEEKGILGEDVAKKKYKLRYLDLLKDSLKVERNKFRVGMAQIGLSQSGDILQEFYTELTPGLFGLREDKVETVRSKIKNMLEIASSKGINVLVFPELTIDLNHDQLFDDIVSLAKTHEMYLIPGSYHDRETKRNISVVVSPDGILWEQEKHIPAMIRFEGKRLTEGIKTESHPRTVVIGNTEFGRIAIIICRDFLDMDLRVELKNFEPAVDIIINPAFTPVTADFRATHFDARRSIYAYCFFVNVAEFGDSLIYTPEKERVERTLSSGEEDVIYKDVDLFKLRSERKKWAVEQRKEKPFIQSTR